MEARHPFSSDAMLYDPMRQVPSLTHQPRSRSSNTYTGAPSTGHQAPEQSITSLSDHVGIHDDQSASAHQHRQTLTPDQHDFSHAGAWAAEPHADTLGIDNDPILSAIHQTDAANNAATQRETPDPTVAVGTGIVDDAVELLRASLHREVP